eukprot:COSAG04_NODE_16128_length_509_cov_0.831707_2_plen_27_part_01
MSWKSSIMWHVPSCSTDVSSRVVANAR